MQKYLEVLVWYVQQHPRMFVVLGLAVFAIAGMWWLARAADRSYKNSGIILPPDYED